MRSLRKPVLLLLQLAGIIPALAGAATDTLPHRTAAPKIQAAILLDVSGSMQGLIEQAKAQLWNMMNVMGRVQCAQGTPAIEIALYEYGRRTNSQQEGYVRQISPFTNDLDSLSRLLFGLTIDGSEEHCAQAIYQSVRDLNWDSSVASYKVIFIAGNEDFMQGKISYTEACGEARKRGVIVNTIYCGPRNRGIDERWDLGNQCGNGSYTYIYHNLKEEDVPTPYDSILLTLNRELNDTYLPYGRKGARAYARQAEVDSLNFGMSRKVAARRVAVKSQSKLYHNGDWDLVDALERDSSLLLRVDKSTLPQPVKIMSDSDLIQLVKAKKAQRLLVQQQISDIQGKRDAFLADERSRITSYTQMATLETEIEKIIQEQVKRFNMIVK